MNRETSKIFFKAAITGTKSGSLVWSRTTLAQVSYFSAVDHERSFITEYGDGRITIARSFDDCVRCFVKPSKDLGFYQIGDDDEPELLRLYNIVYARFPSIDSFLDNFIANFGSNDPQ